MHKTLHPSDDMIDYMYQENEEEKDSPELKIASMTRRLHKKSKERLITATKNSADYIKINRTITGKKKWEKKQLYGYFKRQTDEIFHEKTRTWLRKREISRN